MNRGQTYTIITAPQETVAYKVGYHHGATGRNMVPYQDENYAIGYADGYAARTRGTR